MPRNLPPLLRKISALNYNRKITLFLITIVSVTTLLTLAMVSFSAGSTSGLYITPNYFSLAFKKHSGHSPTAYRGQNQ